MLVLTLLKENCCLFACVSVTLGEVALLEDRLRDLSRGQKFVDIFSFHMNCNSGLNRQLLGPLCLLQSYRHGKLNVLYLYLIENNLKRIYLFQSICDAMEIPHIGKSNIIFCIYMSAKQMLLFDEDASVMVVAKMMLTDRLQEQPRDPMGLHAA